MNKPVRTAWLAFVLALATTAAAAQNGAGADPSTTGSAASHGIDWRRGDVDAAFAEAQAQNKPIFLYWGAVWCPPCNQVKSTIFNRSDFIERSRSFVAVYIDGDGPNAQKLGQRFKVSGYPTMVLFRPDGSEITRIPGEVDATHYLQVLTLGMNAGRPIRQTLASALAGGHGLRSEDWRMLSYYSFETDEQQLVQRSDLTATLVKLAANCPAQVSDAHLRLKIMAQAALADGADQKDVARVSSDYGLVLALLSDAHRAREQSDLVLYDSAGLARHLAPTGSPQQRQLVHAWDAALVRLEHDASLSQTERLDALDARIDLARIGTPEGALPATLTAEVRSEAARADRETQDAYERQSVVNSAAGTLGDAGLLDASDAMLKAELTRSHSPYYFMSDLAANAKKRGDKAAAIDWLGQAYASAQGAATRLQWGGAYVRGLIELAPDDEARIESVIGQVLDEAAKSEDVLYERNRGSLRRVAQALVKWNKDDAHAASMARIKGRFLALCTAGTNPTAQSSCTALFEPEAKSAKA